MEQFTVKRIGTIKRAGQDFRIVLEREYAPGLAGAAGFRHLNVIWWFSGSDRPECRERLRESSPYRTSPQVLGTFATRSPVRPNPLALSCVEVLAMDEANGSIDIAWIDADDGAPVLDIKPYIPSLDRVERPGVPAWCAHWPVSCEVSGDFDWERELR